MQFVGQLISNALARHLAVIIDLSVKEATEPLRVHQTRASKAPSSCSTMSLHVMHAGLPGLLNTSFFGNLVAYQISGMNLSVGFIFVRRFSLGASPNGPDQKNNLEFFVIARLSSVNGQLTGLLR